MGKKFEEGQVTAINIVTGYQFLGLQDLLGSPGLHTAVEFPAEITESEVEVHCLPGRFSKSQVRRLFKDAGLLAT